MPDNRTGGGVQHTTRVMSKIIPKEDLEGIENWTLPEVNLAQKR